MFLITLLGNFLSRIHYLVIIKSLGDQGRDLEYRMLLCCVLPLNCELCGAESESRTFTTGVPW